MLLPEVTAPVVSDAGSVASVMSVAAAVGSVEVPERSADAGSAEALEDVAGMAGRVRKGVTPMAGAVAQVPSRPSLFTGFVGL